MELTGLSGYDIAGVNTIIGSCQDLTTGNSTYTLNQSITVNGTCFNINASNITLDGAGFNITGNGSGIGVWNRGYANVTIKSFKSIASFDIGINLTSVVANEVYNNTVNGGGTNKHAITLTGPWTALSTTSSLRNNTIVSGSGAGETFGKGIFVDGANTSNITENSITATSQLSIGIDIDGGSVGAGALIVSRNSITLQSSLSNGVRLRDEEGTKIVENNVTMIQDSAVVSTTYGGVYLISSAHNNISQNRIMVAHNTTRGLVISSSGTDGNNSVELNTITTNLSNSDAIYKTTGNSAHNKLRGNSVTTYGNGSSAYDLEGGINTSITNDILIASTSNDIVNSAHATLTNVTFNRTDTGSTLNITVRWYASTTVKNSTKTASLHNINIPTYNSSVAIVDSQLSDVNGTILQQSLTEFIKFNGTTTYATPHNFTAVASGTFRTRQSST